MKTAATFCFVSLLATLGSLCSAQSLPVGAPVLEESFRRLQLKSERDASVSFMVRPVHVSDSLVYDSLYNPQDFLSTNTKAFTKGKIEARLLPVTFTQQYNTHHPYIQNDGSMIQARGYQNRLSAGFYSKIGFVSVQVQPEFVFAQNQSFSTFPLLNNDDVTRVYYQTVLNRIDNPEQLGPHSFTKVFPGQSSVRFNFKKLSLGISTENLWWGPGIKNSLLMSNNAPGFPHLTFNSTAPVASPVGSFEWQVIGGHLKSSGALPDTSIHFNGQKLYFDKGNGDRYMNGVVVAWQPKWLKGLYVGVSDVYYVYKSDMQPGVGSYLPVFSFLFKQSLKDEQLRRDQMFSMFFRFVLLKERAEFYGEFGRNDYSLNPRDILLEPEHSRAYLFGFRKLFESSKNRDIEFLAEFCNLQSNLTRLVRDEPIWYEHHQVWHGYTQLGQVIGAGIGPGGSSQTMALNWIKGAKKFGVEVERRIHNNDFYFNAFAYTGDFSRHWADLSVNLSKSWSQKRFLYAANLSLVRSLNYHWQPNNDVTNLHAGFSVSYLF